LVERNVAYFPDDGLFRTTLGIVQYRAGSCDKAIATLSEADRLDEGRRFAPRGFVQAMAHWRNGEKSKAVDLFKKADAWMIQHRPGHPELLRARDEAAMLLGLAALKTDQSFPDNPFAE
jgi:hypothetical protein